MDPIKMVDLQGQYQKIKAEIDGAIQNVIDSTAFIKGPAVKGFQQELEAYLSVNHVVPCANGTDALQVALMALDLQPGDEVITTSFTFISTVEVIALLQLKPVFVDIDPNTFLIDTAKIEKKITPATKAIIPVHLFGQSADMEGVMTVAEKHDLFVIEDNAQAIGSDFSFSNGKTAKTGTMGHIGCTSFFPAKTLGCFGDGGAITTNDQKLAEKMQSMVNHGSKVKYYHDYIGVNSRLDALQAAILSVKLNYLDDYIVARQKAAAFYDEKLGEIDRVSIPAKALNTAHTYHQYTIMLEGIDRNEVQKGLKEKEIPSMVYYPVPLHLQNAYGYLGHKPGDLPHTEAAAHKVLSLPMHTELTEGQLNYVVDNLRTTVGCL